MSIARLLLLNSSVLVTPAAGFVVVIVLTRLSHLSADALYFFLFGLVGFMSLLDGGLPYKNICPLTSFRYQKVVRSLVVNWSWAIVPVTVAISVATAFTDFAMTNDRFGTAGLVVAALFGATLKLLSDAVRVLGLQSPARGRINALCSVVSVLKATAAFGLVNRLPFLYSNAVLAIIELAAYLRVLHSTVPVTRIWHLLAPSLRFRPRVFRDYLVANIGYILGSSVDRIVAFYYVGADTYRGIVLQLALYNMALLPHKLVEAELVFGRQGGVAALRSVASPLMSLVGASLLGAALWVYVGHPRSASTWLLPALGAAWLAISITYNKQWAFALKTHQTRNLANGTRVAGAVAAALALAAGGMYERLILVASLSYAVINFAFALRYSRPSSSSMLRDTLIALSACALSYAAAARLWT